jgi:thioredoxin 1
MKYFVVLIVFVGIIAILGQRVAERRAKALALEPAPVQIDLVKVVEDTKGKVLLHFWKPDCPPCELMEPMVAQIEREYPAVKIFHINTELPENRPIHDKYEISVTPTFVVLENGHILARNVGTFSDTKAFLAFLRPSKAY